jgi:hypothetical protein
MWGDKAKKGHRPAKVIVSWSVALHRQLLLKTFPAGLDVGPALRLREHDPAGADEGQVIALRSSAALRKLQ